MAPISRRGFLTQLGVAVLSLPFPARAQKAYRIGVLTDYPTTRFASFRRGLRDLGHVEGGNLLIEERFDKGNLEALPAFAADLVKLKVDLIFASSSTYVRAAKQATRTIPIVFAVHNDPVGTGDVASLARPGGNITGLTQIASDLTAKQLQLLAEIVPRLARLAVVWNPTTPSHGPALEQVDIAARTLGMQISRFKADDVNSLERAFAGASKERADAAFVLLSPLAAQQSARLASLAAKHRLPALCGFPRFVEEGGLLSYGPDLGDLFRRAAGYVDRILKGARPGDLPVEQPTKFELLINLKTARALRLKVAQPLLLRADKVIE